MAHGGAREGAGRKKGAATRLNEDARKTALETGISPLDYMLSILRNDGEEKAVRLDAAKAAAPYVHAKLSAVTVGGDENNPVKMVIEWQPSGE